MNGDVGMPYRAPRKPDGIIVWCCGVVCGVGATLLWLFAMFGRSA